VNETPPALVEMTRSLGQPHLDYVIIGEGNTSYRADDDLFWIKASGQQMNGIGPDGFVPVHMTPILEILAHPPTDSSAIQQAMDGAKADPSLKAKPSVEVTFHAALLNDCDVRWIAHTHPVAVNRLLCSTRAQDFACHRMFPDEVVLCGPESVFVPYVDPGLPLALEIRRQTQSYMQKYGEAPKVVLLANHGLIALAQTPVEALSVTAMCVKAAGIFAGACAVGEPVFVSEADIMHIYKRPDEIYRRKRFVETGN
jgi:rhamnose utilization protein RhaD (predicted bifunctional aldolase and dehydrogenase)